MSCKLLLVLFLAQLVYSEPPLVGRWVENDKVRTGLYDFLWARGEFFYDFVSLCNQKLCLDVSYFKRMYAAKWSTWKYEQTIVKEGEAYRISGISKFISLRLTV